MKTRSAVLVELKLVREMLAALRRDGREDDTSLLYGAQQALIWMLGEGDAPSHLMKVIEELASRLEQEHG